MLFIPVLGMGQTIKTNIDLTSGYSANKELSQTIFASCEYGKAFSIGAGTGIERLSKFGVPVYISAKYQFNQNLFTYARFGQVICSNSNGGALVNLGIGYTEPMTDNIYIQVKAGLFLRSPYQEGMANNISGFQVSIGLLIN